MLFIYHAETSTMKLSNMTRYKREVSLHRHAQDSWLYSLLYLMDTGGLSVVKIFEVFGD
jgi:hypothetical protein